MFELLDAKHTAGTQACSFNRIQESLIFFFCLVVGELFIVPASKFWNSARTFFSQKKCRKNVEENCCRVEICVLMEDI